MKLSKDHNNYLVLKILSLNSLGVILKTCFGFVSQKVLATYLGPQGIALYGNLRNIMTLFTSISVLGINSGIIKYVAEYKENKEQLKVFIATTFCFIIAGTSILCISLFFGAEYWSRILFNTTNYSWLFYIFAFTTPFLSAFTFLQAIVNGYSDYKKAVKINLLAALFCAALIIALTIKYNLEGAFIGLVLTPIIQFFSVLCLYFKNIKQIIVIKPKLDTFFKNKLLVFSLMSTVTVILSNVVDIRLRNHLMELLNKEDAGYWTGMTNISTYYLSFIMGFFSVHVLPRFSIIKSSRHFIKELKSIYTIILPVFAIGMILVYFLRFYIIQILFSKVFIPMEVLFKWQLMGDFIKIISMILGYQFLAKQLWKSFIVTEIISIITFYILSIYCIDSFGIEGITMAHFFRYIIYLIIVIFCLIHYFYNNKSNTYEDG